MIREFPKLPLPKRYEYSFLDCSEYNFNEKMENALSLGWQVYGNINPYRAKGSGGEQTWFTIPLRRLKKDENE